MNEQVKRKSPYSKIEEAEHLCHDQVVSSVFEIVATEARRLGIELDVDVLKKSVYAHAEHSERVRQSIKLYYKTLWHEFERLEHESKRTDNFGRFLVLPIEHLLVDKPERGKVVRAILLDYISTLKSILGLEFVDDYQMHLQGIVLRYQRADSGIDWHLVFRDLEAVKMMKLIATELKRRFAVPHAIPYFIKRMNQSHYYIAAQGSYNEADMKTYLTELFKLLEVDE